MTDRPPSQEIAAPTLRRALGLHMAMAVVVGNVIGSGIFLKPGKIAAAGGSFGLILSVWVLGGVLCFLGALCFAELATMLPRAGGLYVYLREAYGRPVAFLFAWNEFLFGRPASIGALAVAFAGSLTLAVNSAAASLWGSGAGLTEGQSEVLVVVLATLLIALLAWVNIIGVIWGGRVQLVTTVIKAGGLALIAATPFLLLPLGRGIDAANYATTITPAESDLGRRIGLILLAVMWAYNGWHAVTPLAEEIRNPQRNIPLALLGGIGLLVLLYLAANCAYHGVLSMDEMSRYGERASEHVLKELFGLAGLTMMSGVIMCSTFGAINTNLLQAPRVTFAMGRDGVFFRQLGQVHANYRTPAVAIFVTAVMAVVLVASVATAKFAVRQSAATEQKNVAAAGSGAVGGAAVERAAEQRLWPRIVVSLRDGSIFKLLTNFVIFSASIFYALAVLAVVVLRWRRPNWPRPYRTWGYPVVPAAFVAVYIWFLWQIYTSNPLESRAGLVLIAVGVPVFLAYRWWAGTER